MAKDLLGDERLERVVGSRNYQAVAGAIMEIEIQFGRGYGPPRPNLDVKRTPMNRIVRMVSSEEKSPGAVLVGCHHCGSDARDRRLYSKKGCRYCRNSLSDAFAEGW